MEKPRMNGPLTAVALALLVGSACGQVAGTDPDGMMTPDATADDGQTDAGTDGDQGADAAVATCAEVPAYLVARYRAEENALDESGRYHGSAVDVTYGPGRFGSAFVFESFNPDSIITVDDGDELWPSGAMSVEAWVKTPGVGWDLYFTGTIVYKSACDGQCDTDRDTAAFILGIDQDEFPHATFRPDSSPSGNLSRATGTASITDDQWHHLVGVRDPGAQVVSIYVDGVLAASYNGSAALFGPMSNLDGEVDLVRIGHQLNGSIDELAIYHSALSADEVSDLYRAPEGKCQ